MTDIISIIGNNEAKVYGETLKTLPHDLYIPPDALEIFTTKQLRRESLNTNQGE